MDAAGRPAGTGDAGVGIMMECLSPANSSAAEESFLRQKPGKCGEMHEKCVVDTDDHESCSLATPPLTRSDSVESIMSVGSVASSASAASTASTTGSSQRPKLYYCDYEGCNKAFTRPSLLTEHQLTVHQGIKPYKCEICGKAFAKKSHLKRHMFSHTDEKPYECSVCGKRFTTRQQLRRHEITHTKSFHCPYEGCNESFYKHQQLRAHILAVHEKKLTCPICGKTFQRPYRLKAHMEKHHSAESATKYQCDYPGCGEVFPTWSALQQHKKKCHPKIPCPICGKLCVGENGLRNHMMVHNETLVTKNWDCAACPDRSFAKKSELVEHIQQKHNDIDPDLLPEAGIVETHQKQELDSAKHEHHHEHTNELLQESSQKRVDLPPTFAKKRTVDELGSIDSEVKIRKYIESGKSTKSLLLNTVGKKRVCPYSNCNRTFKSKEKFDKHMEKHKIHDLKMKILEEQNAKACHETCNHGH